VIRLISPYLKDKKTDPAVLVVSWELSSERKQTSQEFARVRCLFVQELLLPFQIAVGLIVVE
ncbi:MAG: hypothetical protein HC773_30965, partial [Scytonema sp. CRU_2_7]|nr:hypothetical protein [Scytonema sp. CRU_2_7]